MLAQARRINRKPRSGCRESLTGGSPARPELIFCCHNIDHPQICALSGAFIEEFCADANG